MPRFTKQEVIKYAQTMVDYSWRGSGNAEYVEAQAFLEQAYPDEVALPTPEQAKRILSENLKDLIAQQRHCLSNYFSRNPSWTS